jgi:hypothetical protein
MAEPALIPYGTAGYYLDIQFAVDIVGKQFPANIPSKLNCTPGEQGESKYRSVIPSLKRSVPGNKYLYGCNENLLTKWSYGEVDEILVIHFRGLRRCKLRRTLIAIGLQRVSFQHQFPSSEAPQMRICTDFKPTPLLVRHKCRLMIFFTRHTKACEVPRSVP